MKKLLAISLFIASLQLAASAADLVEPGVASLLHQGIAAYQRGQYAEAVRYLSARVKAQPPDANAYYYLGNAYLSLKQNEEAARMFSACIKTSPTSQAGQYSLQALERLSTMPKSAPPPENKPEVNKLTPEQVEASREALTSEKALDKSFNEAARRIRQERVSLKQRVDRVYERLAEELSQLNRRSTPNFYGELARTKSMAEIEVEKLQKREQRWESRLLAPDKIDVRAVPELPEKKDDSKNALGALAEYLKDEKPYDPLDTELTPELTAKFMTVRDVFGDLSTYEPNARRIAKEMFLQLKTSIEGRQDSFDMQIYNEKERLIRDIYAIQANYPNQTFGKNTTNPLSYLTSSSIPRSSQENMSQLEIEISQAADRTKKRFKDIQDSYTRDVDNLIAGTKERLAGLIGSTATASSQWKKPHGTIQVVPIGTTLHTRNYVNFGDRDQPSK